MAARIKKLQQVFDMPLVVLSPPATQGDWIEPRQGTYRVLAFKLERKKQVFDIISKNRLLFKRNDGLPIKPVPPQNVDRQNVDRQNVNRQNVEN
jgi:hypothetical protein